MLPHIPWNRRTYLLNIFERKSANHSYNTCIQHNKFNPEANPHRPRKSSYGNQKQVRYIRVLLLITLWKRRRLVIIDPGWSELAVILTPSSCMGKRKREIKNELIRIYFGQKYYNYEIHSPNNMLINCFCHPWFVLI